MPNMRDVKFASFNLYNLEIPGKRRRGARGYTQAEYDAKLDWSAFILKQLDADIIAFQELWSKQALKDLFAHAGLDSDYDLIFIGNNWYDIAVAAAVRKKDWRVKSKQIVKDFPDECVLKKRRSTEDDDVSVKIDRFSRSILCLNIEHVRASDVPQMKVFCSHLKSKLPSNLDKPEREDAAIRKHQAALGAAISTIRRTAEAAALRILLSKALLKNDRPVVLLGDLNDGLHSNTLNILSGQPTFRLFEGSRAGANSDRGMYLAQMLQQYRSLRNVYYSHSYQGDLETLDHVLVSEQFYDHSENRRWSFREMRVFNDHLEEHVAKGFHNTSDHGVVTASFDWNPY